MQTRFQRPGGKNDKPPFGRPRITTPFEFLVIVTSTWRNRFITAWKLLKFLSHATDTRISVCTTRNRLWGARLIFELWNLNFNIDHFVYFWWRKFVYFRNDLLKMFTFVRYYMNFIFSKVFVNIKTVLQNYCTQCLYWLNFFFWVYVCMSWSWNKICLNQSFAYTISQTHYSPILTPEGSKVRRVYLVVHDMEIRIKPSTSYPLYFDSTGNRKLLQSDLSFACY